MSTEDRANEIRGFKATLSNPKVSDEAKEHARQQLKELGAGDFDYGQHDPDQSERKNPGNVAGGLKAAVSNPHTSDEAKKEAQEKLDKM